MLTLKHLSVPAGEIKMTDSVSASIDGNEMDGDFSGHPEGLYVCLATELWERFFIGMKYLLLFYVAKYHLFSG